RAFEAVLACFLTAKSFVESGGAVGGGEPPHAMRGPYIEREQSPKTSARTIAEADCHGYTDHRFRARGQPRGVEGKGAASRARAASTDTCRPRQRSCLRARQSLPSYGLSPGSRQCRGRHPDLPLAPRPLRSREWLCGNLREVPS